MPARKTDPPTSEVGLGATLERAVVVKGNAHVRNSVYIIGPDVRGGNAVKVKNSVLMGDTACGHLSYVGDSVLGANVNFGAGTTVATSGTTTRPSGCR